MWKEILTNKFIRTKYELSKRLQMCHSMKLNFRSTADPFWKAPCNHSTVRSA